MILPIDHTITIMAIEQSQSSPQSILRGTHSYETRRCRYFNGRIPETSPSEIVYPHTTADVVKALEAAGKSGTKVGVRSGGHSFPCASLRQDGLLIDTSNLNRTIDYDATTETISFGPANTSQEFCQPLADAGRFFPFGHHPTVGAGGFLLAGGQGWFMRGWGCTSDTWITRLEVVLPDGRVLIASQDQNQDIFWAARGAGQGFFGVVTRFWARTIPARKLHDALLMFDCPPDKFKSITTWVFEAADETPKDGVDITLCTFYADRDPSGDDTVRDRSLLLSVNLAAYAHTLSDANAKLDAYFRVPEHLRSLLRLQQPTREISWQDLWDNQHAFFPLDGTARWQCDSILNDPKVARSKVRLNV